MATHGIQTLPHALMLPTVLVDSIMVPNNATTFRGCEVAGLLTMAIKKVPKTAFLVHVLFGAIFEAHEHGLAMLS